MVNRLKYAAKTHKFRDRKEDESESDYRRLLADHVENFNPIESEEIRLGKSWEKFTFEEKKEYIIKKLMEY